jgi:hypothetical protein
MDKSNFEKLYYFQEKHIQSINEYLQEITFKTKQKEDVIRPEGRSKFSN